MTLRYQKCDLRRLTAAQFARSASRSTGAAVEQELFAMDLLSGAAVDPARVRRAIHGRPYAGWVSFEPGGQVELSLPASHTPGGAVARLERTSRSLAADLLGRGIVLAAGPTRDVPVPRYLRSPRYDAMERHFDTLGPAGRRMMRCTASTQVCLDWWPGRAGVEQWRVLLLAAPFLAAATARSTGAGSRLATWLSVDPSRTAFDARLLHGDDPVSSYSDFAVAATPFVRSAAEHLTTLFPPVRPRGRYLEIRFPDARPAASVGPLVCGLAALIYDDARRRAALAVTATEQPRLAEHWHAAAAGTLDPELGLRLLGRSSRRTAVA